MAMAMTQVDKAKFISTLLIILEQLDSEDELLMTELASPHVCARPALILAYESLRDDIFKIDDYAEKTLTNYLDWQFKHNFRMSSATIQRLTDEVAGHMRDPKGVGRTPVPVYKKVLMSLFHLAHEGKYRLLSERFGVQTQTAFDAVRDVCEIIVGHLLPKYVKWPSAHRQQEISDYYEAVHGFPGVIGSLDSTHIKFKCPVEIENDYYNRKQTHSINVQATCDEMLRVTSLYVGFPGRAHDSRVFHNSPMFLEGAEIKDLIHSPQYHLLGDSAYPLLSYLLTPHKDYGQFTPAQRRFNSKLSAIRSDVERTFGKAKGRWKILKDVEVGSVEKANLLISAAFVLHNFGIHHNEAPIAEAEEYYAPTEDPESDDDDEDEEEAEVNLRFRNQVQEGGAQKRQRIMALF